jgi:hypothetical protein
MLVDYLPYTRTRAPPPRGVVALVVVSMNMDVMTQYSSASAGLARCRACLEEKRPRIR